MAKEMVMARISKAEHGRILRLVDTEHRKVAEVAVEYGCTPANIYALLGKLRRAATEPDPGVKPTAAAPAASEVQAEAPQLAPVATADATDLFAAAPIAAVPRPSKAPEMAAPPPPAPVPAPAPAPTKKAGLGAALAKPGVGLVMRTAEGEENLTPFRSLEDLLSAVKPILRAAARSPDAVWFSIHPVDLATLDSDAA
jgi:transposase-like protein